jgi:hypothetical protein
MKKTIITALAAIAMTLNMFAQDTTKVANQTLTDTTQKSIMLQPQVQPIQANARPASYYLKRGANRQLTSLIVVAASAVFAAATTNYNSTRNVAPFIILGTGNLVASIMYISGIFDYRKAGIILNQQGN